MHSEDTRGKHGKASPRSFYFSASLFLLPLDDGYEWAEKMHCEKGVSGTMEKGMNVHGEEFCFYCTFR